MVKYDAQKKLGEIFIFAAIGDPWDGITAKGFGESFQKLGAVDEIIVYINSPGGDVFQGNTIYNLLKNHSAKKTVHVVGLAASIASVIAMAGDTIKIAKNGFLFIHDAQAHARGLNAQRMRRIADELDLVSEGIASTYADRSGRDALEMRKLMRAETLMNADKVIELGLADELMDPAPIDAMMPHVDYLFLQNKEAAEQIKKEISASADSDDVDGKSDGKNEKDEKTSESGIQGARKDSEEQSTHEPSVEELQARRSNLDLKFFMAERGLREMVEREKRD